MTKMLLLRPEVSGGFGPNTIVRKPNPEHPEGTYQQVENLEYVFEGWLGDELITSHPVFIVTKSLAEALLNSNLSGFRLDDVFVYKSEQFDDFHPDIILPKFSRLVLLGRITIGNYKCYHSWSETDMNQSLEGELVVSQKAYNIIQSHSLSWCDVDELNACEW